VSAEEAVVAGGPRAVEVVDVEVVDVAFGEVVRWG
jgi:hypothetical protein